MPVQFYVLSNETLLDPFNLSNKLVSIATLMAAGNFPLRYTTRKENTRVSGVFTSILS